MPLFVIKTSSPGPGTRFGDQFAGTLAFPPVRFVQTMTGGRVTVRVATSLVIEPLVFVTTAK